MNLVNNALIVCMVVASEVLSVQPTPANAADDQATAAITHLGEMITIPAGNFIMGNDNGALEEKPEHSVYLPTYPLS
jgi:formylglycine-generating enzyme required for sulfatase activity